ncbi:MAG: KH domain-containing protein [Candidatus Anstonellaceae archaeon]
MSEVCEFVMQYIKIPKKRVEVLEGEANSTLYHLEKVLNVKLYVEKDGEIRIEGPSVDVFFSLPIIKAIGRGFEPSVALKLKQENYGFNLIDLKDYAKRKEQLKRIKGRIIGKKGKTKRILEEEGQCDIAIFGSTVGIIADLEFLDVATTAVFKLIEGIPHGGVYLYLEKNKKKFKQKEFSSTLKMS